MAAIPVSMRVCGHPIVSVFVRVSPWFHGLTDARLAHRTRANFVEDARGALTTAEFLQLTNSRDSFRVSIRGHAARPAAHEKGLARDGPPAAGPRPGRGRPGAGPRPGRGRPGAGPRPGRGRLERELGVAAAR